MRNYWFDHHVHTNDSPDADKEATMTRYIKRASELNMAGVVFTDHLDLDTPVKLFQDIIDYTRYHKHFLEVQKNSSIPIRMGIEIGYQPHLNNALNALLGRVPFDFVICSMHVTDGLDYYNGDFFLGKTQDEAYMRYFESVLEAVNRYDNYDVFGHLDYIIRYGGYETKDYAIDRYEAIIKEILNVIVRNQKGLEINTSGFRYDLGVTHPKITVLKWFKELGGEIVTLGSDAHKVDDLAGDFDKAVAILKEVGFTKIATFKQRKVSFIEII